MRARSDASAAFSAFCIAVAFAALMVGCDRSAGGPLRVAVHVPAPSPSTDALVDGVRDAIERSRPVDLTVHVGSHRDGATAADARIGVGATIARSMIADASDPTFFAAVVDPVAAGLVASLADDTGPIVGVASLPPIRGLFELVAAIPDVRVVGYLYDRLSPDATAIARLAATAAPAAGIELVAVPVDIAPPEPDEAAAEAAAQADAAALSGLLVELLARVDAILVDGPLYGGVWIDSVLDALVESAVPMITVDPVWGANHGALIAYGTDPVAIGRATGAALVDSIRRDGRSYPRLSFSTEPGDLVLVVSLVSGERAGIELPSAVIDAADTVLSNGSGAADDRESDDE